MNNTFGTKITVTIFGESHGPAIGCVVDGLPAGLPVDTAVIDRCLAMRRPQGAISTARREADRYVIESGVYDGHTTGTPVCIVIPNEDTRSADYAKISSVARPSHADYAAFVRYNGANDTRGGGHFSGRITAAVVAAGALLLPALQAKGILIGTHIAEIAGILRTAHLGAARNLNVIWSFSPDLISRFWTQRPGSICRRQSLRRRRTRTASAASWRLR